MREPRGDHDLASAFRQFYAKLSDLGGDIEADPWRFSKRAGDTPEERGAARQQAVSRVRTHLRSALEEQAAELAYLQATDGGRRLAEAQYVMAALADEVFVNLEWEGRELWARQLLEAHMFGSHVSGERLFERAEALMNQGEDADWELAFIYLSAISLGFLGKYRGVADDGSLQRLRRRLLAFVTRGRGALGDNGDPLFPETMEYTLESTEELRLPPVRRWATILAVLLVAFVALSHVLWVDVSAGLWDVSHDMRQTTTRAGGDLP